MYCEISCCGQDFKIVARSYFSPTVLAATHILATSTQLGSQVAYTLHFNKTGKAVSLLKKITKIAVKKISR